MLRRLVVLLVVVVAVVGAAYSRFGKAAEPKATQELSINEQMMRGRPIVYYGRFRDGADDVLNRFFNRL